MSSRTDSFSLSDEMSRNGSISLQFEGDSSFDLSNLDSDKEDAFSLKLNSSKRDKKQEIEIKQLQHDLQLARIELAQRDYQINSLKLESTSKCEALQEKVHELKHENQILNTRLNSIISIHKEEEKQRQENLKLELTRILVRQKELEDNNERLLKNEQEIKKELRNIDTLLWSNEEYEFMSRRDEDLLTIKEYATLKLNTSIRPLKSKLEESVKKIEILEDQLRSEKFELERVKQTYENERKSYNVNSIDNQKLYYELADTKALLQQANFKKDNYDRVKFERDDFERKFTDSEVQKTKIQTTLQVLTNERDDLMKQINQLKQEISLLKQDKDYLQKNYVEAQAKSKNLDDKLEQTTRLYDEIKISKEELYEKLMHAKDSYKHEYDLKLTQELDELKLKTNNEIEKLRVNTKEFYEREIKTLKESKDMAIQEKEKHELTEKETNIKYQEAMNELRIVQLSCENKVSELKSELKLKTFELERAQMLYEESMTNNQKIIIENTKLHKKAELIQNEFYALKMHNDKRFLELENELSEKKARLENYEKVENEMDLIIKQVAESSEDGNINETEAEKLLLSYGYGANIMMNSKRRIQQNVHLTKRILHLEQVNTMLRHELNKERDNNKEVLQQLDVAKNVIENTKQPHEFLVRSIQSKETQLIKQQSTIENMKSKIDELSTERESLLRKQNEMASDIEKLIRQNDELFNIRDEFRKNDNNMSNKKPLNLNNLMLDSGINDSTPKPLMFTSRFNRLAQPSKYTLFQAKSPNRSKSVYSIEKFD